METSAPNIANGIINFMNFEIARPERALVATNGGAWYGKINKTHAGTCAINTVGKDQPVAKAIGSETAVIIAGCPGNVVNNCKNHPSPITE